MFYVISMSYGTKRINFIYISPNESQNSLKSQQLRLGHVPAAYKKAGMFTKLLHRLKFARKWQGIGII